LIDDAKAALGVSLDESRLKVELPVVVPVLEIDPLLIGQVLINLLDNAIRFAPPNTPIVVSAEIHETHLTLAVSNEGPSIEESKKEVLFKSFAQFDTGGRAGLGLAIARTFVEAHGEKIWVENTNDVGVRFVFTLPLGTVARN
jgi:two-component system sensor histidine kinase KdpD